MRLKENAGVVETGEGTGDIQVRGRLLKTGGMDVSGRVTRREQVTKKVGFIEYR